MRFEITKDIQTQDILISIRVPHTYIIHSRPADINISSLIDMDQFFGMLEDVICLKLGLELPKSRNVSDCVDSATDTQLKSF